MKYCKTNFTVICLFIISFCSTGFCGKIVYPFNATTAIVKAGESFTVWFDADTGQKVTSVELRGPYNTVSIPSVTPVTGSWQYDQVSGNTYDTQVTVTVPSTAPADRYDLLLNTSAGQEISQSAVKVVKEYKTDYTIFHISDTHMCQGAKINGHPERLFKISALVDIANIIGPEMVFITGDLINNNMFPPKQRADFFYKGSKANGLNGVHGFNAATFSAAGNHDFQESELPGIGFYPEKAETWNQCHGLQYYHFKYGSTRCMVVNTGWNGFDWAYQLEDHASWLKDVGQGNLRLAAYHKSEMGTMGEWTKKIDLGLAMIGHNHHLADKNPYELGGKKIQYYADSVREHFHFNLFRVDGKGNYTVVNNEVAVENWEGKSSPFIHKLTLDYAKANDGSSMTNTATLVNKFDIAFPRARVRFVMPKGAEYTVLKGTIEQQFDGDSVRVVDVRVAINANSTTTIEIKSSATPNKAPDDERTQQIVDDRVNWSDFLGRHDIVWEVLPEKFDHGSFHGNGLLGAMIYKDARNRLRWEVGRSDVTDHRRDNNRLPIGGMGLETVGDIQSGTVRLDLWNAESIGEIQTTEGSVKFRSFIHAEELALVIEIECTGKEKDAEFKWLARPAIDSRNVKRFVNDPPNPPSRNEIDGDIEICIQPRIAGGEFSTAWKEVETGEKTRRLYLSIADTFPANNAAKEAANTIKLVAKADFATLVETHRQWWHSYYPKSFISVPDAKAEGFYWAQMYKLACATRQNRMPIDLLGPWFRNTGWPRIWWNLNIEIAYSPVYTSNHLELGESLTRMMDRNRNNFARNALDIYGVKDGATVPHTTCFEGLRGNGSAAPDKYINPADFTWALHNYWLQYRYSMDKSFITDHDKHAFYPLLRGSVNVFLHILKLGDDGRYHLPVLMSPEYAQVADNNYNLSMLRWACQTLLDICKEHDIKDPLIDRWQQVLDKLVDYPVDETGFMVGANMPLERSHRHWQHLQMVFPLYQLDFNDADQRGLIEKSILHWQNIENGKQIFGWSDAAASCLYSVLQDGNNAYKHLIRHHENKRFVMPNTMYIEGSPVIECSLFAAKSLQEMLLQSWGETIRVFPAVPDVWEDVVFHDLRTEGAFLVSASRKEGTCQWVRIKSLAGEPCRVIPGLSGKVKAIDQSGKSVSIAELGKGLIEIDIKKGQEIILYNTAKVPQAVVNPLSLDIESHNYWGVKLTK